MEAIILAAGRGTRMESPLPKVLHEAVGKPLVSWVIEAVAPLLHSKPILVVGYGQERVRAQFGDTVKYAVQAEQLGTGHAVLQAREYLAAMGGYVYVLAGDMPLLTTGTLRALGERAQGRAGALLSAVLEDPTGYGRVVKDSAGLALRIVEHKDATHKERAVREINASVYCFDAAKLLHSLAHLTPNNAQGEYYLTDCVAHLRGRGEEVAVLQAEDPRECLGVNSLEQLREVEQLLQQR